MAQKTNAIRLLDKAKIAYQLVSYEVDENDLSATHVATLLGEKCEAVFKTLVLRGDRTGIFVCVIPADKEVDLKKVARVSGNKSCALTQIKELLALTGYIRGGCSPIGMKKAYPSFIDSACQNSDRIYISAGCRGLQVQLSPADLIAFVPLSVADLTE